LYLLCCEFEISLEIYDLFVEFFEDSIEVVDDCVFFEGNGNSGAGIRWISRSWWIKARVKKVLIKRIARTFHPKVSVDSGKFWKEGMFVNSRSNRRSRDLGLSRST
jgi:hypothetical protein